MGSEMCIRDRHARPPKAASADRRRWGRAGTGRAHRAAHGWRDSCLLYTSDAADERSSVDLGGRRIIKKKNKENGDCC